MPDSNDLTELIELERIVKDGGRHLEQRVVCEVDCGGRRFPVHAITLGNASADVPAVGFFGGVHGMERIGAEVVIAWLRSLVVRLQWDSMLHRQLESVRLVFMPVVNPGGMRSICPVTAFCTRPRPSLYRGDNRVLPRRTSRTRIGAAFLSARDVARRYGGRRLGEPVSRANAVRKLIAAARYRSQRTRPAPRMLVLTSTHDELVDTRCSRALALAWNCDIAAHPNAGHDIALDDGRWVANEVRGWLRQEQATGVQLSA